MGKMRIKFLILLFMLLSHTQTFSQEMQWTNQDSIETVTFDSTDKILEWGKGFGSFTYYVESQKFCIKDNNIFILMVDRCSGLPCYSFYVFREKSNVWELQTTSQARFLQELKIRLDNDLEKIIFETSSYQIGELPFSLIKL